MKLEELANKDIVAMDTNKNFEDDASTLSISNYVNK
jgi:hypothetical protein